MSITVFFSSLGLDKANEPQLKIRPVNSAFIANFSDMKTKDPNRKPSDKRSRSSKALDAQMDMFDPKPMLSLYEFKSYFRSQPLRDPQVEDMLL